MGKELQNTFNLPSSDVPGFDAEAEDTFDAWVEAFHAWQQKEGHQRWPTESSNASAEEKRLAWRHRHMQTRHVIQLYADRK